MNNSSFWKYAGLSSQLLVGIGLSLYIGLRIDQFFHWRTPLAVWILPLLLIVSVIVKIVVDTNPKK